MHKLGKNVVTIEQMENVRLNLNISQFDFGWMLGVDHAKYNRLLRGKTELGHTEAGLIRYVNSYFSDYPFEKIITAHNKSGELFTKLQRLITCAPVKLGRTTVDANDHCAMGAILFKSKAAARAYEVGSSSPTLTGSRWVNIFLHCMEIGEPERALTVVEMEALSHNIKPVNLLRSGW